jgi:hypothetical protein
MAITMADKVFPLDRVARTVDITSMDDETLLKFLSGEMSYDKAEELYPGPLVVIDEVGIKFPDIPEDSD